MRQCTFLLSLLAPAGLLCANGCMQSAAPPTSGELSTAFTYTETPEASSGSSAPITLDANKQLQSVDYNSRITIAPDKVKLRNLLTPNGTLLSALSDGYKKQLTDVPALLKKAQSYLADAQLAFDAVVRENALSNRVPNQKFSQSTLDLVGAKAKKALEILDLMAAVAEFHVKTEHPAFSNDDVFRAVGTLTDPVFVDASGKPVIFNVDAFATFINNEVAWLAANAKADHDKVAATAKLLRIRAQLTSVGKQPGFVHVDNYDTGTDSNGVKEGRLTFTMDDTTKARIDEEQKSINELATAYNELKNPNSKTSKTLKQLGSAKTLESVLDDLRNHLKAAAAPFTDANTFAALKTLIQDAAAATADPTQKSDLLALEDSVANKIGGPTGKIATLQTTLAQLDDLKQLAKDPTKLPAVLDQLNTVISTIPEITKELSADLPRINTLIQVVPAVLQAKADQVRKIFTDQVMKELAAVSATSLADYPNLTQTITAFLGSVTGDQNSFAGDANLASGIYKALPVDDLVPATIHLDATPAREGDRLQVRFETVGSAAQTQPAAGDLDNQISFNIEKFGLINTWSTSLAFARPMSGPGSNSFVAAPSLAWTLHYRPRISSDTDFGGKTWSYIDPGAGVNVEGLNFNNTNGSGVQVGVGGHVSVFHDLLQLGAGYNLSVSHDRGYVYVGIGVFQTLQQAGNLLNAARQ